MEFLISYEAGSPISYPKYKIKQITYETKYSKVD